MKLRSVLLVCSLAALLSGTPGHAQDPQSMTDGCAAHGTPSYTATRTIKTGTSTISANVFVTKGMEREETKRGGDTLVRITAGDQVTIFELPKNVGMTFPARPPGAKSAPQPDNKSVRMQRSVAGEEHITTLQAKETSGWVDIIKVVCRADGVMLRREFPINHNGQTARAVMSHSNIELKAVPAELFKAPPGAKIDALPPPPK